MPLAPLQCEMRAKRGCGLVTLVELDRPPGPPTAPWLSSQLATRGWSPEAAFEEVFSEEAYGQFAYLFSRDLAYGVALASAPEVERFWDRTLDHAGRPLRYFSNAKGMDLANGTGTFTSISGATFDGCLVFHSATTSVLLLVEDED